MFVDDAAEESIRPPAAQAQHESPFAELAGDHSVRSTPHRDPYGIESVDPLDIPFEPDDFEPTAQPRSSTTQGADIDDQDMAALLDEPMSADDFDRPPASRTAEPALHSHEPPSSGGYDDTDMAALLDAPISPDEFDAPAPARQLAAARDLLDDPPTTSG